MPRYYSKYSSVIIPKTFFLELITKKLEEQKEQLTSEFTAERASHQKMIGEYARLEQRFDNLQQELQIEKTSPDKRRRSQFDSGKNQRKF